MSLYEKKKKLQQWPAFRYTDKLLISFNVIKVNYMTATERRGLFA